MSRTIKKYSDLCEEKERLENLLVVQKQRMKDDWGELKNEFTPVKKVFGVFGKMASPDKSNPLMNAGLKVATDLFITKFVLGKAGWVTRIAVPFVLKNYSTHVFAERGRTFLTRAIRLFNQKRQARTAQPSPDLARENVVERENVYPA